jgi:hypothetical protein
MKEEIVPGVRGLTLEYYDGLDWYDNWGDASLKKQVKYTTTEEPNLSGFPEAVRITLLLDPNPGKSKQKQESSKKEPAFAFQTVVRLEMADVQTPSGGSDSSSDGSAQPPGQNPSGGGN